MNTMKKNNVKCTLKNNYETYKYIMILIDNNKIRGYHYIDLLD